MFCEKPIALTLDAAREMIAAAQGAQRQLMIGHCIRFWPEYAELKRLVDSGAQGRLLSLSMSRRTGRPGYTAGNWVNQPGRCLGAALDLHIHDTDFLSHLLGTPRAVVSQGIEDETGWSSITTQYHFRDLLVSAEAAWNYPPKWGFQMRFAAVFERAVLDFDSRNTPSLTLTVGDSSPAPVTVPQTPGALGGYYHELAYFVDCVRRDVPVTISTGEQATESLRVVLAEIESAQMKKPVHLNP